MKKKLPLVSVIITTLNEEAHLGHCLKSLKEQTYPQKRLEIIVVDNYSLDKTKEIAKKYNSLVFNQGPERSAQRNFGGKKAKGEYLLFLDADMLLSCPLIEKAVLKMKTQNLAGLYLPEVVLGRGYWEKTRRFERSFYDGTVIDCVRMVKKSIFEKVNGFATTLTGPEDWDFDKKVRQKGKVAVLFAYHPKKIWKKLERIDFNQPDWRLELFTLSSHPFLYHQESNFNLKKYLKKKAYYSKSFEKYLEKWGKKDQDLKKQLGFAYRYFGVFWEKGKWKRLLSHPRLAMGMYFLRMVVGFTYLGEKLKGKIKR